MKSLSEKTVSARCSLASKERRHHDRLAFTASVVAIEPVSGTRIDARTTDVCPGGCYVDSMSPFPAGTVLQLRLTKDGKSFQSHARVVSSDAGVGMGVSFSSPAPDQGELLDSWLAGSVRCESASSNELQRDEPGTEGCLLKEDQGYVLNELLIKLMRKGVLSEEEGEDMLRKLHH